MPVLILGATSRIAQAIAAEYAASGESLYLAARDQDEAERIAADLRVRHSATATAAAFDARDFDSHPALIAAAAETLGGIDIAIVAFGEIGEQPESESDFRKALAVIEVNYTGAVSVCEALAEHMAAHATENRSGVIAGISTVAGDRGRQSNYFYGSAKGGFSLYLQGLRGRMRRHGVHVMTAKLGFVDTPMTYGLKTRIPIASPEAAARAIVRGIRRRKDTLYYPRFWRFVMFAIKAIPERLFKRLSL